MHTLLIQVIIYSIKESLSTTFIYLVCSPRFSMIAFKRFGILSISRLQKSELISLIQTILMPYWRLSKDKGCLSDTLFSPLSTKFSLDLNRDCFPASQELLPSFFQEISQPTWICDKGHHHA